MITSGKVLSLYKGDSFSQNLTAYNDDFTYLNLSRWTGDAGVRYRYGKTGQYDINFNYEVISNESGLFNISCGSERTTGAFVGEHPYNVRILRGEESHTIYDGYLIVYPDLRY